MANIYETVIEEFNKRNCKLLNTKEEYTEILKTAKKGNYKLNYIASCGHNNTVFYNVFKSRGTGIDCPSCVNKRIGNEKKTKMENNEMSKTYAIKQEYDFVIKLKELIQFDFEVIKTVEGCLVDIIIKPKNIIENKWIGIQIKTTKTRYLTYSFHINNEYKDCLLLLYCCEDENMWLIPENIIQKQKKISIGFNKSKYNIYKINKENIINNLKQLYITTTKFEFDTLNTPINIYQQKYRKFRETKVDFIKFDYDEMDGLVYDFKINNFKIQEKVTKINKEKCYKFFICKNNGSINNHIQYDIGDNDFYWLNCDNMQTFFVIPENILMNRGLIGNKNSNNPINFKVTVKDELHQNSSWLNPYIFNYDNIDKERLLNLF